MNVVDFCGLMLLCYFAAFGFELVLLLSCFGFGLVCLLLIGILNVVVLIEYELGC